jgi:cytochrome c
MHKWSLCLAAAAALLATVPGPALAADAERGKTLYAACAACHSDKPDALGPNLKGVVGRKAAALEDFRYSAPMRRAGLTWDDANLRAYILDPQATVKGNRMPFGGLRAAGDVDDIVAYLKTLQ